MEMFNQITKIKLDDVKDLEIIS